MKIVIAIAQSHAWLWPQTLLSSLKRYPPRARGAECEIVLVDNAWEWSPAIRGIRDTALGDGVRIIDNPLPMKFHASALDEVVRQCEFDYLMALETDVLALRPDWLQWFVDAMVPDDYAVGHWHHEQFVNPSCTLYSGRVLRHMLAWCVGNGIADLRWGPNFELTAPCEPHVLQSVQGPFAEKRGWPEGTSLNPPPSGQCKGPGWYEPGQALHHWAVGAGYTYRVCQTATVGVETHLPLQTFYGTEEAPADALPPDVLEIAAQTMPAYAVHLWGGTRALDILKHSVECAFVREWFPMWLQREAQYWRAWVPADVQAQTIELIRQYGFHTKGAGTPGVTDRDRQAAGVVIEQYRRGGVLI